MKRIGEGVVIEQRRGSYTMMILIKKLRNQWSLTPLILFLSVSSLADQPTIIPYDPMANEYKVVDAGDRFKKHIFLPDMVISNVVWIDNKHLMATIGEDSGRDGALHEKSEPRYKSNALGKIVVIDTDNGEIKDFGFEGVVKCHSDGDIVISLSRDSANDLGKPKGAFGKIDGAIQVQPYPLDKSLNTFDCSFSNYKRPMDKLKNSLGRVFELKIKHGLLVSDVNYEGDTPISELYLEKAAGGKIAIPTNPGEEIQEVSYIPHLDAYLLVPDLQYSNYNIPWWKVHPKALFVRLLYPNGDVKRIAVPYLIEQKIKDVRHFSYRDVIYTKLGLLWSLTPRKEKSFLSPIYYLQSENELIELHDDMSTPSLNGCKLIGPYSASLTDKLMAKSRKDNGLHNYYIIDLCEGI